MDRHNGYTEDDTMNNVIDITHSIPTNHQQDVHSDPTMNTDPSTNEDTRDQNATDPEKKSFLQRLGEANVIPDGMVSAIDETDRVLLAMEKGAEIEKQ